MLYYLLELLRRLRKASIVYFFGMGLSRPIVLNFFAKEHDLYPLFSACIFPLSMACFMYAKTNQNFMPKYVTQSCKPFNNGLM